MDSDFSTSRLPLSDEPGKYSVSWYHSWPKEPPAQAHYTPGSSPASAYPGIQTSGPMMSFQKWKWWKNHQNYCKLYCQVKKCFLVACAELREIIFLHYIIYQQPIYLLSYLTKLFLKAEPATRVDTFNLGLWLQRAGMRERGLNGAAGKKENPRKKQWYQVVHQCYGYFMQNLLRILIKICLRTVGLRGERRQHSSLSSHFLHVEGHFCVALTPPPLWVAKTGGPCKDRLP